MMSPARRKKWTESEEKTLIDKYESMVSDGTLAKMKTREKKFRPIALYVNSFHHILDPIAYPWQWTWKDVSTKVQNMRHQFVLVKQKIKKLESADDPNRDEFQWVDGLTHWSNFLRYKDVFGDVPLLFNRNDSVMAMELTGANGEDREGFGLNESAIDPVGFRHPDSDFVDEMNGGENMLLDLEFDYEGEGGNHFDNATNVDNHANEDKNIAFGFDDVDPNMVELRKKGKLVNGFVKGRTYRPIENELQELKDLEAQFEKRGAERDRERRKRQKCLKMELKQKHEHLLKKREEREKIREGLKREWNGLDEESEKRERRREDEIIYEREWNERMNKRRMEWKKRIDEMLNHHRVEIEQVQARILQEQHNISSQLLGILSQWISSHSTGLADHHTTSGSHYLSLMMQNLHHVNGMDRGDPRVEEDNQDDQFIVDG